MKVYKREVVLGSIIVALLLVGLAFGIGLGESIAIRHFKSDCDTFGRVKFDISVYHCQWVDGPIRGEDPKESLLDEREMALLDQCLKLPCPEGRTCSCDRKGNLIYE